MWKGLLASAHRLFGPRPAKQSRRYSRVRCRPCLEHLEDRCVPSLTAAPGYSVSTFTPPPSLGVVQATGPDSVAVDRSGEHVFVGYNNGTAKDGTDGKTSTIVEYDASGTVLHYWQAPGHNDGLKIDPGTGKIWALQNEDGNPNLVVINPRTTAATSYTFAPPDNGANPPNPPMPGGYDDIAFLHGKVYLTESNPAGSAGSAVVQIRLPDNPAVNNQVIIVRQVLPLVTTATDPSGHTVTLTLTDPDSMTVSGNNLVFTSQADNVVLTIHNPGPKQFVTVAPVHSGANSFEVDDTLFTPSSEGAILVVDSSGTVYKITGPAVQKGLVLSSADTQKALGTFDPNTGVFTPVITGFAGQPKGLAFLPTESHDHDGGDNHHGQEGRDD
jgi:hypothetical protein